ncbi:MAG TPA: S-layer homology domain-containing protein [Paenibacillaceae bacterium]
MKPAFQKRLTLLTILALVFTLFAGGTVYAFSDKGNGKGNGKEKEQVRLIKDKGIWLGVPLGKVRGNKALDAASAITAIVKGFNLQVKNESQKASDLFTKVRDNARYAKAFVAASQNGLVIAKDINPNAAVSREQFAKWLYEAIEATGERFWTMIYTSFADEDQVSEGYMESIQRLLSAGVIQLDKKDKFRPKKAISRAEAAAMLRKALELFGPEKGKNEEQKPGQLMDFRLVTEKVGDDILKVTVFANAPHPGYGLEISAIHFKDGVAKIHYRVIQPDPNMVYPQVITQVQAVTYIPSSYKAELHEPGKTVKADAKNKTDK